MITVRFFVPFTKFYPKINDTDSKADCYISRNVNFITIIIFLIIIQELKFYLVCQQGHKGNCTLERLPYQKCGEWIWRR